jgi:hypothetical protein
MVYPVYENMETKDVSYYVRYLKQENTSDRPANGGAGRSDSE